MGVLNGLFLFGNSITKVDKGKRDETFLSGLFICISNDNSKKVVCICNQHDKSPIGKTKLNFPSERDKKIVGICKIEHYLVVKRMADRNNTDF